MRKIPALAIFIMWFLFFGCQKEITEPPGTTESLVISGFSPDSVKVGDLVVIKGQGFDSSVTGNIVVINHVQQEVLQASDTTVIIRIAATTITGKIVIKANHQQVVSVKDLVVSSARQRQLSVVSFSPDAVRIGDTVIIKGQGFSAVVSENLVAIHTTSAQVLSANDSLLIVKVLPGTSSGKIIVGVNGQVSYSSIDLVILSEDVWTRKQDFPFTWPGNIYLNGNGFVKGFSSASRGYFFKSNRLWEYNPTNNKWTSKTSPSGPSEKNFAFCFTIGTKAYVGLGASLPGNSAPMTKEVWQYDMTNDTWTRKNDFPGAARVEPFSFSIKGFGFVGGGDTTNGSYGMAADVWRYDPSSDGWKRVADFPGSHSIGISGFNIENTGFVLEAGQGYPTAPTASFDVPYLWSYNGDSDTWTQKATLPANGRTIISATVFTIEKRAFAAIGATDNTMVNGQLVKNDFWEYIAAINTWIKRTDVGGPVRWFGSSFAINGKGYVGVGNGERYDINHTDLWQYNPE